MKNMQYNRYYTNISVIMDLATSEITYHVPQNVFLVSKIVLLKV